MEMEVGGVACRARLGGEKGERGRDSICGGF